MSSDFEQLEISRVIAAERDRVFAAWTDPTKITQWWGAGGVICTHAELDLTVGGAYRFANQGPNGATMWITGTFTGVDAPRQLSYTWAMEPIDEATEYSLVVISFDEAPGGTLVTIVQTRIPSSEARDIHLEGWIGCLKGLDDLIGSSA